MPERENFDAKLVCEVCYVRYPDEWERAFGESDVLMGYRESGPGRNVTLMRYAGRCVSCGCRVHIVPSGFGIMRDRV